MTHRTFSLQDQEAFALLSGDHNPLHVDAVLARRYLFGEPIVHGVHALMWGLECLLADHSEALTIRDLRATFLKPNTLGEPVEWAFKKLTPKGAKFELRSRGVTSAKVNVSWSADDHQEFRAISTEFPAVRTPRIVTDQEIEGMSGAFELAFNQARARELFPSLTNKLSPLWLATLLASTRLVGSECPGLHSIFSDLRLSASASGPERDFRYTVSSYDPRFRLAAIDVAAPGVTGTVLAVLRPTPVEQHGSVTLKDMVRGDEFASQRALVIGGSRGLGEITAKLLAMGGAEVILTYQRGLDDSARVVADITANGGRASAFQFDSTSADQGQETDVPVAFAATHIYYFATPTISLGSGVFDEQLFERFNAVYVVGFARTVRLFHSAALRGAFWPSSVYANDVPEGLTEYAASKAAGEVLGRALERSFADFSVYMPRLPRLATDQTVSFTESAAPDPAPPMLAELRAFQTRARSVDFTID